MPKPVFRPGDAVREAWGDVDLRCTDANLARVTWTPALAGFRAGSLELTRPTRIRNQRCLQPGVSVWRRALISGHRAAQAHQADTHSVLGAQRIGIRGQLGESGDDSHIAIGQNADGLIATIRFGEIKARVRKT